jgi:predicted DNA-binding protein (MmcQ/YjbR family)
MSLHRPAGFADFIDALPATSRVEQWDSHVAKVGGKVFALCGNSPDGAGPVVLRVEEQSFEILTAEPGISQAPYFAKRRWIAVVPGALEEEVLVDYLRRAHALVAAGLTRKLRAELGL